jgi:hypothetical protein
MLTHAAAASAGTFHVALSAGPALELGGPEP